MGDGVLQAVHHLDRQDGVQIFGVPVGLRRRARALQQRQGSGVGAQFAAALAQGCAQIGQQRLGHRLVNQQRFGRAANARAAHLGVQDHGLRLLQVRGGIDVGVAQPVQMAKDRHAGLVADALDQAAPTARHHHVDGIVHAQHKANRGAIGGGHALHAGLGQARSAQAFLQRQQDFTAGMEAI